MSDCSQELEAFTSAMNEFKEAWDLKSQYLVLKPVEVYEDLVAVSLEEMKLANEASDRLKLAFIKFQEKFEAYNNCNKKG